MIGIKYKGDFDFSDIKPRPLDHTQQMALDDYLKFCESRGKKFITFIELCEIGISADRIKGLLASGYLKRQYT